VVFCFAVCLFMGCVFLFQAQYLIILCTFKDQLQQHVRVHAVEAVMACREIETTLQALTGLSSPPFLNVSPWYFLFFGELRCCTIIISLYFNQSFCVFFLGSQNTCMTLCFLLIIFRFILIEFKISN
jgi:hypothetical protein